MLSMDKSKQNDHRFTYEHNAMTYTGSYRVESGTLRVWIAGPDSTRIGPLAAILRGKPIDAGLRMLLREYFGSSVNVLSTE